MYRRKLFSAMWLTLAVTALHAQDAQIVKFQQEYDQQILGLLKQYCYDCHNQDLTEADLDL
ncbi:MAG: hypothetical protein CMJ79_04290, partial [Planctomycetaceae bacterium]|nr:hypothetical protein [Planctomycetaceae bacterium]